MSGVTDELSRGHSGVFRGGKLRLGIVQKAVNLHLKYLWCMGLVKEPPHCPFDRNVLGKLGVRIAWTRITTRREYEDLVRRAGEKSKGSIANWELALFNKSLRAEMEE